MRYHVASDDPSVRRSESFWHIFESDQNVGVLLPGKTDPIRIPTERERDLYWSFGPSYFDSPERFADVQAYMKHYYLHADGAPEKYWEQRRVQNEKLEAWVRQRRASGQPV